MRQELRDVPSTPHHDRVEALAQRDAQMLDTSPDDRDIRQADLADDRREEGDAPLSCLDQTDLEIGPDDREWDPGYASAGSDIG